LREAEDGLKREPAKIEEHPDPEFTLAAGYFDPATNAWHTSFEVRELTGRDEEAISKTTKIGTLLLELLQRGLVRVGDTPGDKAVDGLLAGDWETVLLAIRSITFGQTVDYVVTCRECRNQYEVTVDLLSDIPVTRLEGPDDARFSHTGRHGTEYEVVLPLGSTQRKILQMMDKTVAEQNTVLLKECVERIDGRAALPEQVSNMPLADRRAILRTIIDSTPGPRLGEVKSVCPNCGAENVMPLSIAALFQ
jgi:hypothetical protein